MQRGHFQALARALKETKPPHPGSEYAQWQADASKIADVCAVSNASFNRVKFLKACGV
jgi:hypothetical protein